MESVFPGSSWPSTSMAPNDTLEKRFRREISRKLEDGRNEKTKNTREGKGLREGKYELRVSE